ncbi:MAG: hypothetical protein JNJ54_03720 [Myxococcaceae bacterium]|nr:hypothetical protein [Myxococcaceae bacterium]
MDLLLLALLVALAVWTARGVKRRWAKSRSARARAKTPGFSADNPLVLRSGLRIDEAVAAARCECGGVVKPLGETTRLGLRVARGRCVECDEDVDLYFVLPKYVN